MGLGQGVMPWGRVAPQMVQLGQGTVRACAGAKVPEDIPGPAMPGHTHPTSDRFTPTSSSAGCRRMGLLREGCREAVLRVRKVVLSNYQRGRSHSFLQCRPSSCTGALSAVGPSRQWFHGVCLLLATVASCICFSADWYLQKDVVSIADSHSFCKQLGRNQNRKYFEFKVYFSSRTETTMWSLKNRWLTEVKYS